MSGILAQMRVEKCGKDLLETKNGDLTRILSWIRMNAVGQKEH